MAKDKKAPGFKRICVFCGTNPGERPEYGAAARELGKLLADEDIELVYAGAARERLLDVERKMSS